TEVWLEPPAHPVAAASGEHVRGVLKKLRGLPQQRLPRCPIQLSHRAPSRRIVLSLAAHRRNSSATITGFPHFTAFFALLDCEPASATTSTSVFVLVSVGTATSPRDSAMRCSSSLPSGPWAAERTEPEKHTRAPGISTAATSTGPSASNPSGSTRTP